MLNSTLLLLEILPPQSNALSRLAFIQLNPIHYLSIQNHSKDHGRPGQIKAEPGTAGYSTYDTKRSQKSFPKKS